MKSENSLNNTGSALRCYLKKNWPFALFVALLSGAASAIYFSVRVGHPNRTVTSVSQGIPIFEKFLQAGSQFPESYPEIWLLTVLMLAFMLLFVYKEFSYLFNKQKLDFYHALPVKKNEFLISKSVVSLIISIIPFIVFFAVMAAFIPLGIKNGYAIDTSVILSHLAYGFNCWCTLAAFIAMMILCAVSSGRLLQSVLSFIGMALLGVSVELALRVPEYLVSGYYVYGYATSFIFPVCAILNPSYNPLQGVCMLAVTALLFYFSFKAYGREKSENAQANFSYRLPVTVSMLTLEAAVFFAVAPLVKEMNPYVVILIAIALCAVVSLLWEFIVNRGRNLKKTMFQFALFSMCGMVFYVVCTMGLLGYSRSVKPADIESVTLGDVNYYYELPLLTSGGRNVYETANKVTLTSDEAVSAVADFHKKTDKAFATENYHFEGRDLYSVEYKLKNGKTKRRFLHKAFYETIDNETIDGNAVEDVTYMHMEAYEELMAKLEATAEYNLDKMKIFGDTDGTESLEDIMALPGAGNVFAATAYSYSSTGTTEKVLISPEAARRIYEKLYTDIKNGSGGAVVETGNGYYAADSVVGDTVENLSVMVKLYAFDESVSQQDREAFLAQDKGKLKAFMGYFEYFDINAGKPIEVYSYEYAEDSNIFDAFQ